MTTSNADAPTPEATKGASSDRVADLMASIVVFLVALPLCIGIAMASGVPVERGLITGIVGGLVVGVVTGSPLLVSGPAASLLVLVMVLVQTHGLDMLGPVVVGAGLVQAAAGWMGLGQWFRAVSPAVIRGMMSGIGVLITASQLHVVLDGKPKGGLFENLSTFPAALAKAAGEVHPALLVGIATVALLVGWKKFRPKKLALVPPQLVAVVVVVLVCHFWSVKVNYLEVKGGFFDGIDPVGAADMLGMMGKGLWVQCLIFAFVASAATLLTATAIDQVQTEVQTDYDQELFAQGIGNTVAGMLGGLPMTGVIVRSSANVEAGAKTKLSTILHGAWLLIFVASFPAVLGLIPKSTLAAILVVVGCNLAHPDGMKKLDERGRGELIVGLITLFGVVGLDLFSGILLGLAASILRLVYAFNRFEVRLDVDDEGHHDLYLEGFGTFLKLPVLARALDSIPAKATVKVHLLGLEYADHACFEQIAAAERRLLNGGGRLDVEWEELDRRYAEGPGPAGGASLLNRQLAAMRRHLHAARRSLGMEGAAVAAPVGHLEVPADRVFLDHEGDDLEAALRTVAPALYGDLPGDPAVAMEDLVQSAGGQALDLGEGVVLVHAYHPDVEGSRLGFLRLSTPLKLATASGDLLFVLLDREGDAENHLLALGGLARICASPARLEALRSLDDPAQVASELTAGFTEAEDSAPARLATDSTLVVIEAGCADRRRSLAEALRRTFGDATEVRKGDPTGRLLAGALGIEASHGLVLVDVPAHRLGALDAVVAESEKAIDGPAPRVHVLEARPAPAEAPQEGAAG